MGKQIVVAVVAVGALLGAYLFLTQPKPQREAGSVWRVPDIEAFDRFDLRRGDVSISIERVTDGWRLSEPIEFRARPRQVERVEDLFANSETRLLVDSDKEATPNNLTRYGFDDDGVLHVTLYDGGQAVAELSVGDTEEDQSSRTRTWVRPEGSDRLYRLNRDLRTALDHELGDWRDNEVVAMSREQRDGINAIDIAYAGRTVRFEKTDDVWTVVEPADLEIDPELVTRWVRQVDRLRAADFADDVTAEEAALENPEHRVTFHTADGDALTIELGAAFAAEAEGDRREERRYARFGDGPIFAVSQRDADRYLKRTGDFRPRTVLDLERDGVARIDLVDADERIVLVPDTRPDEADEDWEATWQMQVGAVADVALSRRRLEPVDMGELRRVLTAVTEVEALRFDDEIGVAGAGLETPIRRVVVRLDDDTEHVIEIGATAEAVTDAEADADHFVRVDDGLVFVLRDFKVRNLLSTAAALRPEVEEELPEDG